MRINRYRTVLKLDTTSETTKYKEVKEAVSEEDPSLDTQSMSNTANSNSNQSQKIPSNDALAQLAQSLNTSLSDFGTQQQSYSKAMGQILNLKA